MRLCAPVLGTAARTLLCPGSCPCGEARADGHFQPGFSFWCFGRRQRWRNPSIRCSGDGWATRARKARGCQGAGDTRTSVTVSARPGVCGLRAALTFSSAPGAELNGAGCPASSQDRALDLEAHPSVGQLSKLSAGSNSGRFESYSVFGGGKGWVGSRVHTTQWHGWNYVGRLGGL